MAPMDLEDRLLKHYEVSVGSSADSPWIKVPLPFSQFVRDEDHMNFPVISELQEKGALALLGNDPLLMFNAEHRLKELYEELVLLVGKGGGKGVITAFIFCYIFYVLSHLKNPQLYLFGINLPGEPIDMLNVASSADQAANIFFEKFRQRLMHWKWLRRNFRVRKSSRDLDFKNRDNYAIDNVVIIHPREVLFPHNIRSFSRHSQVNTTEGLNIIISTIDESSGFPVTSKKDAAEDIHDMLKTSSQSRFPGKSMLISQSFPRYEDDFTVRKYKESLVSGSRVFGIKATTWDMKPIAFGKERFDFQGFQVPLELWDDFDKRPIKSKTKYLCEPPTERATSFVEYPERIDTCVTDRPALASFVTENITLATGKQLIRKKLVEWLVPGRSSSIQHVAWADRGEVNDGMCLVIAHLEATRIIIDLILEWFPNKRKRIPVDVNDVEAVIKELKKKISIVYAGSDHWQASGGINNLNAIGIKAEKIRLNASDYANFKDEMYAGQFNYYKYNVLFRENIVEKATIELKALQDYGGKIDHPAEGTNEISVCFTGVTKVLREKRTVLTRAETRKVTQEPDDWFTRPGGDDTFEGGGISCPLS